MKKLALALAATTILAGSAVANISTGFYLGAHVGMRAPTGEARWHGTRGVNNAYAKHDIGSRNGSIGLQGGYGMVNGCVYFGGELYYTFVDDSIKSRTAFAGFRARAKLHRNGVYGLKGRLGGLLTPSTMFFVSAAVQGGKWKARASVTAPNLGGVHTRHGFRHHNKNNWTFVPGVGFETAVNKNVYFGGEYTYEFGNNNKRLGHRHNNVQNGGFRAVRFKRLDTQQFVLRLSYKF